MKTNLSNSQILRLAKSILGDWKGPRIKALRRYYGVTQGDFGHKLGARGQYAKILAHMLETGKQRATLDQAIKLEELEQGGPK